MESHNLPRRVRTAPDPLPLGKKALEDTHGLKEIEPIPFRKEKVGYRSNCSPALGGHRLKGPSPRLLRCSVVATSCVNELSEAYKPRNFSSTVANKKTPLPTYCSSSNVSVTSMPRQIPFQGIERGRRITRRLVMAVIPKICCCRAS